jgi:hypothetical protein
MSTLIEKLERLPPARLFRQAPATPEEIARVEAAFGIHFPDDFREVMRWSNGFGMSGPKSNLNVEPLTDLESDNLDEEYEANIPGMFVLGTDGGGSIYFFDPHDQLGNGAFALYLVPLSELGSSDARLCGRTFTEALTAVLAGEDFFQRPKLRAANAAQQ